MHQNVLRALRFAPLGVHHLIALQAARTPGLLAAVCGEQRLTYAQLERQASLLACALQRRGIGAGECVAVYLAPSVDTFIALLAILKAGGCYVPLEIGAPVPRVLKQLEHCGASLLLTHQKIGKRLSVYRGHRLYLDQDQFLWIGESSSFPVAPYREQQVACIMYSSNACTELRGVQISQQSLLTGCLALFECLDPESGWQFALASTLIADLGYSMLFLALLTGGCLHLLSDELFCGGSLLTGAMPRRPFDVLKLVPSHLLALLNAATSDALLPRKQLLLGGECCDWSLLERLRALKPTCRVYSHYGSIECSVGVLLALETADRSDASPVRSMPPGRPLPTGRVYVLDAWGQLVPPGVVGELYVGGDALAYGYLDRPSETAQRFVPDPFGEQAGARLYRTGDRVYWLPDGNLQWCELKSIEQG